MESNCMPNDELSELRAGFETAYIDGAVASSVRFCPKFISNNFKEGKKVISSIEDELLSCDSFQISVAFITDSGIAPLLQTLQTLEAKGINGEILTTNYLNFSEPKALEKLNRLSNITLKMYDVEAAGEGFHTKGYIFKTGELYRIIVGSSNITSNALTSNHEWNTKLISTEQGEMAQEIVDEFNQLWNSDYALSYDDFFESYKTKYQIIKHQRDIAKAEEITTLEKYKLKPNVMQVGFITNLKKILDAGENRALLISATGTGKTYASAFAMRELGFKRVLFLVHRAELAASAMKSFKKVFNNSVSMGLVGAGHYDYDKDYVFATIETMCRDGHLKHYDNCRDCFDCIIIDEAHHAPSKSYRDKVMTFFTPSFWLGMTATPDKRDDGDVDKNVYELFNHQIAYEIRLQQAMEEKLLCPFHYFGITDLAIKDCDENKIDFSKLTSDERINQIIGQANYFGYSGNRVKGLIFCSSVKETEELSNKFNQIVNPETGEKYRTIALNGASSTSERQNAFERLAMDEKSASGDMQPLDYILSRDILNEGVDIVEVNQVIMLRPTQSPIVFIQQLGRGLRKAEGKEYVVILDFIGNYDNNFMIPIALSGDRTYNADNIRKYVISGNNVIPGASTVHFDEIAKEKIFHSIDHIRGIKTIIKESYISLKNRLNRRPLLYDFYRYGETDPMVIVKEYKTYWQFLESLKNEKYTCSLNEKEKLIIEYLSKTILSGVKPEELYILKQLMTKDILNFKDVKNGLETEYDFKLSEDDLIEVVKVLQGNFISKAEEYQRYKSVDIIEQHGNELQRVSNYKQCLGHLEFKEYLDDIINVGLTRYSEKYSKGNNIDAPFVLYEKYTRRDVSLLMKYGKDMSSTMYGMSQIGDDVFLFVTYHKQESNKEDKLFVEGRPDYADEFVDNLVFKWESKIGNDNSSTYMGKVKNTKRKHLFVKKSDAESSFYYMGQFNIIDSYDSEKEDNTGNLRPIARVTMKMHQPVREDLLRYLQSSIKEG